MSAAIVGALTVLVFACITGGCGSRAPAVEGLPEVVDFNFHVKPILSDRCFACHGPDEAARKAGVRLHEKEGLYARLKSGKRAVIARKPGSSELVRRVLSTDPDYMMPPRDFHLTLSDFEKAVLVRWIEQGAHWKPHWSFIPPVKADVPDVAGTIGNDIDRFVLSKLDERGLKASPQADRETLIRRVSFDLTGLPPTIEEIDAFLEDEAPDAYEKVVDRLLDSPAYGERMAAEWMDIARYADSHGYQDDGMREMSPWRDWVIEAFNENMPFDRFLTWQLAGDLLPKPTQEQLLATAFNRHHPQSQEGGIVAEEYRVEYVADRVNTLGAAFLGITVECARCHDHKFDPILQKEYYQLSAFFNSVNESGQIPYSGMPSPTVFIKDAATEAELETIRKEIIELEAQTAVDNAGFDEGFEAWSAGGNNVSLNPPGLIGHYDLDEIADYQLTNLANRGKPASVSGDRDHIPETVPGRFGNAQKLVGDSYIDAGAGLAYFERNEPFTLSLWFHMEEGARGPLITRTGGIFNGNRGYEVIIHEGGVLTAGLHHVFPDNSIEIETLKPVTPRTWHHGVLTYDGSSRASGLRLFLDGARAETKVNVDNLHASILRNTDGENWGGGTPLSLGKRHDETLSGVSVDEFRVYDRQLTTLEVTHLHEPGGSASEEALREHYVLRVASGREPLMRKLNELRGRENKLMSALPQVMTMRDRAEPRPTFVLTRGAYDAPAEPVTHGTPQLILPFGDDLPRNRLGLAKWLIDPKNPLTARVLVNRYWSMFFGNGIVATPEDFGSQGRLPTHPELLDWLAVTFRESGWDLKALVKTIVTSATYRQSSDFDAADPANEWLARGPSYRRSAEQIRDNALFASGLLVPNIGGPSVYPYQPPGLWEELATRNATTYIQGQGDDLYRRSLYTVWKRSTPPPSMISFDAAERYICIVKRQRTNTPMQALVLLNDPQYLEASRMIAERMLKEAEPRTEERITYAFRLLTGHRPSPEDLALMTQLYEEELEGYRTDKTSALSLLSVGEHPRDRGLEPAETAAYTIVASTIMNSDEAVYKR